MTPTKRKPRRANTRHRMENPLLNDAEIRDKLERERKMNNKLSAQQSRDNVKNQENFLNNRMPQAIRLKELLLQELSKRESEEDHFDDEDFETRRMREILDLMVECYPTEHINADKVNESRSQINDELIYEALDYIQDIHYNIVNEDVVINNLETDINPYYRQVIYCEENNIDLNIDQIPESATPDSSDPSKSGRGRKSNKEKERKKYGAINKAKEPQRKRRKCNPDPLPLKSKRNGACAGTKYEHGFSVHKHPDRDVGLPIPVNIPRFKQISDNKTESKIDNVSRVPDFPGRDNIFSFNGHRYDIFRGCTDDEQSKSKYNRSLQILPAPSQQHGQHQQPQQQRPHLPKSVTSTGWEICANCSKANQIGHGRKFQSCPACKQISYCSNECQHEYWWNVHQYECEYERSRQQIRLQQPLTPSASQAYHAHYAPIQNARRYTATHGPTHQYQVQQKALHYPQSTVQGGSCVAMIDNRYQALNGQERDNRGHDGHKLAYIKSGEWYIDQENDHKHPSPTQNRKGYGVQKDQYQLQQPSLQYQQSRGGTMIHRGYNSINEQERDNKGLYGHRLPYIKLEEWHIDQQNDHKHTAPTQKQQRYDAQTDGQRRLQQMQPFPHRQSAVYGKSCGRMIDARYHSKNRQVTHHGGYDRNNKDLHYSQQALRNESAWNGNGNAPSATDKHNYSQDLQGHYNNSLSHYYGYQQHTHGHGQYTSSGVVNGDVNIKTAWRSASMNGNEIPLGPQRQHQHQQTDYKSKVYSTTLINVNMDINGHQQRNGNNETENKTRSGAVDEILKTSMSGRNDKNDESASPSNVSKLLPQLSPQLSPPPDGVEIFF